MLDVLFSQKVKSVFVQTVAIILHLFLHCAEQCNLPIAKVFVCKQWHGFEFDSGWQRSVELPFEAIERGKKFYLPTRRHQLRH